MERNITLNSNFTYQMTSGGTDSQMYTQPYWDIYQPLVKEYYYPYYTYWTNEDKISKAFKLAQKLIEKKLIKEPTKVKDFIELVNNIVELL